MANLMRTCMKTYLALPSNFLWQHARQSSATLGARDNQTKDQIKLALPHQFQLHLLEDGPKTEEIELTRNEALAYYRKMLTVRRIEMYATQLYKENKVRGFCHESIGEEASSVGIASALEHGDAVINGYRIHGWAWLRGVSAQQILGELTGRLNGNVHGKGGSMHLYSRSNNFFGGHGIVGAQISLGVGLGFAKKYKQQKNVSVALYGDGASNQGQFYEAANMAALWKLPVMFVCENNGYGMRTPVLRSSADPHQFHRCNYMPGILVDGMDVLAVREAARWARQYCVDGNGPIVLELDTYRFVGHTVTDPGTGYRTREEVQMMRRERDPITHFRDKILARGLARLAEDIWKIDQEVDDELAKAYEMAHSKEELPPEGMFTDIYDANAKPEWVRGLTPQMSGMQKYTSTDQMLKEMEQSGGK